MQLIQHRRAGFALAVAIGAIVVIGALIAGVFFASSQQYRIGQNALLDARAQAAAEYGLNAIFDTTQTTNRWNKHWNNDAVYGVKDTMVFTSAGTVDTVYITKVNQSNFYVVSEARVTGGRGSQARSRIGMLVPLRIPEINMHGALTTRGPVTLGGASNTNGNDAAPAGWACPPLDTALAGVTVSDTNVVKCSGCKSTATGNPPILQDTLAAKDSTYDKFGDIDWATLKGMAKVFPTGNNGATAPSLNGDGTCNTNDIYNWGDPQDPLNTLANPACRDYFPIIYIPGDASFQGGVGQGILLVEGSLTVSGNLHFYGPVIVKGTLTLTGNKNSFTGGLLIGNASGSSSVLGNSTVQYSSCAIKRAMAGSALPSIGRHRSWIQLY